MTGKTIFINGRFLTQQVTGVQRYSLELIRHIDLILNGNPLDEDLKFICLVPPKPFEHPGWTNIETRKIGLNTGNIWEQIDLPLYARGQLLFSPGNSGPWNYRNQAITFHDASVFAVPDSYSKFFRAKYIFTFKHLSRSARLVLTDSNFSREELSRYLELPAERFTVIPPGCNHLDNVQSDERILGRYDLKKNSYLLTVGNQSVHKNLHNLFKAVQSLGPGITLVAVGKGSEQIFRSRRMPWPAANIQMVGYIDDHELKALYENALGFIFPSAYEGFGLPVLEAMRCGCPVLCSNAACMPEVASDAALYFNPHQIDNIVEVLNHFLSDQQLHQQLRTKGYQHSAKFEWSTTAQKVLESLIRIP